MALTTNYGDALKSLTDPENRQAKASQGLDQVLLQQTTERATITAFKEQFTPVAGSQAGVQALEALMADRGADKIQRAAAFETINPGVEASIGANGEISLTAAPGSDLGFKYPVFAQQTTGARTEGANGRVQDKLGNFEENFRSLQSMTDPAEIANAYSAMQASVTTLVQDKRQQLLGKLGAAEGLQQLEQQMQADKVADQAFYNQYYGGQWLGPTDESLAVIAQYNRVKGQVDGEVDKQLKSDPELARISSQMNSIGMLVDAKFRQGFSGELAEKATAMELVGADAIDAVLTARGIDPMAAKDTDRQIVAAQLFSGQANATRQSMEIGMAPSEQVAAMVATSQGDTAQQALRVLNSRTGSPETSQAILKAYREFDKNVLPTLPKEQADALKVPATATAKEKAQLQSTINVMKMGMVIENLKTFREQGFANNAQSWDAPQNPLLSEVKTIRDELAATNKPVSIDAIVQRMDWNADGQQPKIDALAEYIQSQANSLQDNKFFGAPMLYSNPDMAKRFVQTLAVKARTGSVFTMGSDPYGRDQGFRQRQQEAAEAALGVTQ